MSNPDPIDPAAFDDRTDAASPHDDHDADRAADREERWLTRGWD
jgi:hypothetical protein